MRVLALALKDPGVTAVCSIDRVTGMVTLRTVSVPGRGRTVHAFGTERDDRVPAGVEEALRTDVAVPLLVPGAEARGVDLHVGASAGERLSDIDRPGPDREAAANRREPEQVPGPERDGRPTGVDLVPAWPGGHLRLGCADYGAGGAGLGLIGPDSGYSFPPDEWCACASWSR